MNTVIYSVTLRLDEIEDADNTVVMMQSDNKTRIIRAMFYDKDTIEAIDKTAVVQLVIARPDNKVLWVDCHGIDSDDQLDYYNTIESVITADMISVPGNGMGQFLIWNSAKTEVIRSQKFRIRIGKKLDNLDAQEGDAAFGALQEMLDRAVEKYMANNPNIPTKEELLEDVYTKEQSDDRYVQKTGAGSSNLFDPNHPNVVNIVVDVTKNVYRNSANAFAFYVSVEKGKTVTMDGNTTTNGNRNGVWFSNSVPAVGVPAIKGTDYLQTDDKISFEALGNYMLVYVYNGTDYSTVDLSQVRIYEGTEWIDADSYEDRFERIENKLMNRHFNSFSVIGDSYSTYADYQVDSSAPSWYPPTTDKQDTNDVRAVSDMWWYKFANIYGCRLIENNSWSGATICKDGYGTGIDDASGGAFVNRVNAFTTPELIMIFGGTNDEWVSNDTGRGDAILGEYKYSDWTETDLEYFRPALACLIDRVRKKCIGSRIVFILNTSLPRVTPSIEEICGQLNVPIVHLHDIAKAHSHPTIAGMTAIAKQVTEFLEGESY